MGRSGACGYQVAIYSNLTRDPETFRDPRPDSSHRAALLEAPGRAGGGHTGGTLPPCLIGIHSSPLGEFEITGIILQRDVERYWAHLSSVGEGVSRLGQ